MKYIKLESSWSTELITILNDPKYKDYKVISVFTLDGREVAYLEKVLTKTK